MQITNNEKSYGRNMRLMNVVAFFYEMMMAHGCSQERGGKYEGQGHLPGASTPILAVHDHKWHLEVTWGGEPLPHEKWCIERSWREVGEEDADDVDHFVEVQDGI